VQTWLKSIGLNAIVLCLSAAVTLAGAEVVLRTTYPQRERQSIHEFDAELGYRPQASLDRRYVWDAHEVVTGVRTGPQGFRDIDLPARKASNEFRVLLLGDSNTFGYGVEGDETFAKILEERLNRPASQPVHNYVAINAGVIGYGTGHQVLQYERIGDGVAADLVILNVTVSNDIQDNLCLTYGALTPNRMNPCFAIEGGELVLKSRPEKTEDTSGDWRQVLESLDLYSFVMLRSAGFAGANPRVVRLLDEWGVGMKRAWLPTVVEAWYSEVCWPRGWTLTQRLLEQLHQSVRKRGAQLVVVGIPSRLQVQQNLRDVSSVLYDGRAEYAAFQRDPVRPQRLLDEFLSSRGIAFLDLEPVFQRQPAPEDLYYAINQHWNAGGHRVVAEAIEQFLHERTRLAGRPAAIGEAQ